MNWETEMSRSHFLEWENEGQNPFCHILPTKPCLLKQPPYIFKVMVAKAAEIPVIRYLYRQS